MKNAIVVGMPRSGTSLTASVFAASGYFIAPEATQLREADEHNPLGYWEAEGLIERNVEVFQAVKYPHHNTWRYDAISDAQASAINKLEPLPGHLEFVKGYDDQTPWMWKDPRSCYTLGYWWRLIDPENTVVLLVKRDPEQIWQSFIRQEWRPNDRRSYDEVLTRIKHHVSTAERIIAELGIPYVEVNYEDYQKAPTKTADKIGNAFEIDMNAESVRFDKRFNRSSLKGRVLTRIELVIRNYFPAGVRHFIRKHIPRRLKKFLFPGRSS